MHFISCKLQIYYPVNILPSSSSLSLFFSLLIVVLPLSVRGAPVVPLPGQPPPTYSLNDCLQLALERNPDILKAQKDIERTQGLVITAKSTLYPQLSTNGRLELRNDDLLSQGNNPAIQRFRDFWVIQIIATQSLYSGGVNRQQIAIANLQQRTSIATNTRNRLTRTTTPPSFTTST